MPIHLPMAVEMNGCSCKSTGRVASWVWRGAVVADTCIDGHCQAGIYCVAIAAAQVM